MFKATLSFLLLFPFYVYSMDITESAISGKWNVTAIVMGSLGELPAGKNDYFKFENGILLSSAQGEESEAAYTLEENKIVVTYPNKKEVLTVTKFTENEMTFFVNVFVNGKELSAGNISFKLLRPKSGN
ncbi:hypothetical protein [Thalassotalea sp. Y01]|uniref:hypothetical protein n=1 Tax=Thalassotalea sp. Y01 TaxID=2729613 RepID=UPI00145DCDB1|nr:hypothetical protein [Thalassotalea sp. Y01]NMP17706.1 hypothetical protein [Thalassotalea sp. Y01]